ncbi:MAG: M1 family metallopeptidase [Flavobacteriia bacterium]|nr:M1 family metallopeptidase [Flavobacteriia bacterium]
MRKFLILFFLFVQLSIYAQYWQQEVNYKISVRLNDVSHSLSAFEEIEYINHSPNTINELYFHLWPNAYKNKHTALAKQLYQAGEKELSYAKNEDKGWVDSLNFKINGEIVKWELDKKNIDICKITLNKPLISGEKIIITTPFYVKLPNSKFSRLGHVGESYQITQWYPKPAVYDKNGWNPIPYLNQGEFYSEFASFEVEITLPKNYVVGATGDLQSPQEEEFLNNKCEESKSIIENDSIKRKSLTKEERKKNNKVFPPSSTEYKTIRFTQKDVHDFAWFADKRFLVLKGDVVLPHSKEKVTTWAMFTPQNTRYWKKSLEYLHDGIYYYSLWNGDYPYKQVTAIDGTIAAGGGMEYPNITIIGSVNSDITLETVIVHEVGHNWFYGILGSNERVHGWMDEGLNTFNEMRYMYTKYPKNTQLSDGFGDVLHFSDLSHYHQGQYGCRLLAYLGEDQAIETSSENFSSINYGLTMYQKTGLTFHYLKEIFGEEKFDKTMQEYYQTWKFKHPQPEDLKLIFEKSNNQSLSWLFDDLINKTYPVNFQIKKVKTKGEKTYVSIKNKSKIALPINFSYTSNENSSFFVTETFKGKKTFELPITGVNKIELNPTNRIPEMYLHDNIWKKKGFHRLEPLKIEMFIGDHEKNRTNLFLIPTFAFNSYDKFLVGVAVHNLGLPFKPVQFLISPFISTQSGKIKGIAEVSKTYHPGNFNKLIRVGFALKHFSLEEDGVENAYFIGFNPYVFWKFGDRKKSPSMLHTLHIQGTYRYDQSFNNHPKLITVYSVLEDNYTHHAGFFVQYQERFENRDWKYHSILRIDYMDNMENKDHVFRSSYEMTGSYNYIKKKSERYIELRYFIGNIWSFQNINFNQTNLDYRFALSGAAGLQDLFLEEYFINRNGENLNSSVQRMENMGGLKSVSNYGTSVSYMHAFNLYAQLPYLPKIFGVYGDLGFVPGVSGVEKVAQFGLGIRLFRIVGIYFPLYMSDNLEKSLTGFSYAETIRWTLKINFVNVPFRIKNMF